MGRLIVAPEHAEVAGPVVFLAGPIPRRLDTWHADAIRFLGRFAPEAHVASPRRPYRVDSELAEADYAEQVDWETRWLRRAARDGVVLFWLARERPGDHRCDRAHAQTTRFELAEWKEYHRRDGVRLALGIEEGFSGARYVRRRFAQDCPAVQVSSTLEETCRVAADLTVPRLSSP